MSKPILCLDFDGVLHSYKSGWVTATFIPDPPVPGAFEFLHEALDHFYIAVYSSRSGEIEGPEAMRTWVEYWARRELKNEHPDFRANRVINAMLNPGPDTQILFPRKKPAAMVTLDDRAITFDGTWPSVETLLDFRPWNKR